MKTNMLKTDLLRRGYAALAGLTLLTGLIAAPALAQFPGGGGPQGRFPFAFGSVSAVDSSGGTIILTSQFGGGSQTVKVGSDAQIITLTTIAVTDLKVGDKIAVQGIPTGITASAITAGTPPTGLPGMGGGPRSGNVGGNSTAGINAGGIAAAQSFATATGTIKVLPTTTDPHLTLTLGADTQLFLKIADGAKVTKYTTLKLSDLKSGDQIMAAGQMGADGILTATTVAVNLPQRGGPGGGPGRPGGFGGGPGGQGAQQARDLNGGQGNSPGGPGGGFGGPGGGFGGGPGGPDGGGPGGPPLGGPDGGPGGPPPGGPDDVPPAQ